MKRKILYIAIWLMCVVSHAQNVNIAPTITPAFFGVDDEITITYDVTGTSLSSLSEAYIWLWIPNGNVDAPSNINPASDNTSATSKAKFTKSSENGVVTFSLKLTPSEAFDGDISNATSIGMLIKGNDWSDGQSADYVAEFANGFAFRLNTPTGTFGFYEAGESIDIDGYTSTTSTFTVWVDDQKIEEQTGTTLAISHEVIADGKVHELVIAAVSGADSVAYAHTYAVDIVSENETQPANLVDGVNEINGNSVTLLLTAPNKSTVFVLGDFNNWMINSDFQMKKDGDQFWLTIENLEAGKEYLYQYLVDGEIRIADPYAHKISSPFDDSEIINENRYPGLRSFPYEYANEAASYLQTAQEAYDWKVTDFQKPAKEDLIIYELLVRDFTEDRTYTAVIEKLDYLDSLGINAIELMPVMEFEGNISWGYNPAFLLATDKYYGTEEELKALIDAAHERGIAVIFDIVFNHAFGRSPLVRMDNDGDYGTPTVTNPWLNRVAKHEFNVGFDFNHESVYTKSYSEQVVKYWLEEYHIDGYRFDLSKGLTQKNTLGSVDRMGQYDASRIAILKNIADHVWDADEDAYVILEHFAANDEETELANYGMMLWGMMKDPFEVAARGNSASLDWLYHESRGWDSPHVVGYFESHDEERLLFELGHDLPDASEAELLKRAQLAAIFLLATPGPKMIWQFGEMGYDLELNDDRLGIKPTKWEYLQDENRLKLFTLYQSLINLRTKTEYIKSEHFSWATGSSVKWINVTHPDVQISIVANFSKLTMTADPHFASAGTWYNYLTGEEITVTDPNEAITLAPAEFMILTSKPIDNYVSNEAVILANEKETQAIEMSVFPNPTQNQLTINTESFIQNITIRSLSGAVMKVESLPKIGLTSYTCELSNLSTGMYLVEVETQQGIMTKKIYKQ